MLDLNFYGVVEFNENLNSECIRIIRKYQMKVLDGIQLSSAIVAKPDIFIVSDKQLYNAAIKELTRWNLWNDTSLRLPQIIRTLNYCYPFILKMRPDPELGNHNSTSHGMHIWRNPLIQTLFMVISGLYKN